MGASRFQVFNLVRKEAPLDTVEMVLKKDAVLGLSLLRIINSVAMGLKQTVTSLRQVVQLLAQYNMSSEELGSFPGGSFKLIGPHAGQTHGYSFGTLRFGPCGQ